MTDHKKSSLTQRLVTQLGDHVRAGQPGERLPTEAELCEQLGASINKVREALTLLAQEGLIERRQGSGTYVADRLPTKAIGLVSSLDLLHPHQVGGIRGRAYHLREWFHQQGIRSRLYIGHTAPSGSFNMELPDLFEDVQSGRLAGLVAVSFPSTGCLLHEYPQLTHLPIIGNVAEYPYSFSTEHDERVLAALRYLVSCGCRRLALLGWESSANPRRPIDAVLARYRQALPPDVSLESHHIGLDLHPSLPGSAWDEMREIWTADAQKPDGLVVGDDFLLHDAGAALRALRVQVPRDLQIAALTTADISPHPPFPCARLEIDGKADAALVGQLMVALVKGKRPRRRIWSAGFRLVLPADMYLGPALRSHDYAETHTPEF